MLCFTFSVTVLFTTTTHIQSTRQNPPSSATRVTDQDIACWLFYTTTSVPPDDGPVRSETCRSLMFLKILLCILQLYALLG